MQGMQRRSQIGRSPVSGALSRARGYSVGKLSLNETYQFQSTSVTSVELPSTLKDARRSVLDQTPGKTC